jgi:tetratricopeptide (TPR) repeat protein
MTAGRAICLVALPLLATGCSTYRDFRDRMTESTRQLFGRSYYDSDAEAKMADADAAFDAQDYSKARATYAGLADNTRNPLLLAEKARFREAECYRLEKQYPKAVDTYHRLLQDHQAGAYRRAACKEIYEIADYWLDDTRAEIEAANAGEKQPWISMPKLASLTDGTKPRIDREGEALKAMEFVWLGDLYGPYADKALFWTGYVHLHRGNFEEADETFSRIVEFHKESPLRPKAVELAVLAKNHATGGADYDGTKCAEAMQLIRSAEIGMPEFRNDEEKAKLLTQQKLVIRMQQAEKDFKRGQFYERTGHPGSAYFCYELVRRTYPGTKYSDLATSRIDEIKAKVEAEKNGEPDTGMFARVKQSLDKLTGGELSSQGQSGLSSAAATGLMPGAGQAGMLNQGR